MIVDPNCVKKKKEWMTLSRYKWRRKVGLSKVSDIHTIVAVEGPKTKNVHVHRRSDECSISYGDEI